MCVLCVFVIDLMICVHVYGCIPGTFTDCVWVYSRHLHGLCVCVFQGPSRTVCGRRYQTRSRLARRCRTGSWRVCVGTRRRVARWARPCAPTPSSSSSRVTASCRRGAPSGTTPPASETPSKSGFSHTREPRTPCRHDGINTGVNCCDLLSTIPLLPERLCDVYNNVISISW
jgi:hypothetical protein